MDIKYLTYIIAIAEERNMTKAAEKLFVSQSSLSYYLSKLEQDVGTPLFLRAKNELLLTPAGQLYVEAAQNVVEIKKQLYKNISDLNHKAHIFLYTLGLLFGDQKEMRRYRIKIYKDVLKNRHKTPDGKSPDYLPGSEYKII